MKNNYEKYMQEVWDMKDRVYKDFKKSGYTKYTDFLNNAMKNIHIKNKNTNSKKQEIKI